MPGVACHCFLLWGQEGKFGDQMSLHGGVVMETSQTPLMTTMFDVADLISRFLALVQGVWHGGTERVSRGGLS